MIRTLLLLALSAALTLGAHAPVASAQESSKSTARVQGDKAVDSAKKTDPAFEGQTKELAEAIDAIVAGSEVSRGTVGIHVADAKTGQVLYSAGADQPMNPASNMKLITSAAALEAFGPNYTFETEVLADEVADGVVQGSLYVRGKGEAFLLFEDFLAWAGKLHQQGITRIEKDIVVDDTAFDGAYLPPGFEQKDEDASYRSPIGAVSVNFNAVTAVIEPGGKPGQAASCRMVPPNRHVEIVNKATTCPGRRRAIRVASESTEDGTKLIIRGKIGSQANSVFVRKRIDNPPAYAGSVLASALEMVGIEFDGEVKTGATPAQTEVLVSHSSQPLSYILLAMNKWSNNFMAEQLLRALGMDEDTPSTWKASRKAVVDFLKSAGIDTSSVAIHNGSGLYDGNLVSPRQFVQLLRHMSEHRWAPEYLSSLAIAGVDGTLDSRMTGSLTSGNVRGKTGTLNEVSALSGYVHTKSGRHVAFSILFNDPPRRAWRYRSVQDRIVEAIAGFDG